MPALSDAQLSRLAEKYAFTTAQLNARQLAIVFGFSSTWTLKGIRRAGEAAGDSPFRGQYSTIADIRRWLRKHPNFVASHHLRRPDRAEPSAVPRFPNGTTGSHHLRRPDRAEPKAVAA